MKKKIIFILSCLLLLLLLPVNVHALSTANAKESIVLNKPCSLELVYRNGKTALSGIDVTIWQAADLKEDLSYTLHGDFTSYPIDLTAIKSSTEWNTITTTLYNCASADKMKGITASTNSEGKVLFEGLSCGIYLVAPVSTNAVSFAANLVAVPGMEKDGTWTYDVTAIPKPDTEKPPEPSAEYQVTKLWKDYGDGNGRPTSVSVEIYKNRTLDKTVVLSADNKWTYTWKTTDTQAEWTVVERNIPEGYTMSVTQNKHAFIIENKKTGDYGSPKTGDNSNITLYMSLMLCSFVGIIIPLLIGKRKRAE